ncbi:MAG TPA: PQQ-binding-like beta-propeller repeat protein [Candidatus Binatia bacterium]|nr:PQQ-binding-like beta-propeller repeat protein [Candidatus Binatia bacterium]
MYCRAGIFALLVFAFVACSGGGGSSAPATTPISPWSKFRRDEANSGVAGVPLAKDFSNPPGVAPQVRSYQAGPDPILASPAIGLDHTVYFATAGQSAGTLLALKPQTSTTGALTLKWSANQCAPATQAAVPFGPIRSSPAVTAVRSGLPLSASSDKVIFFGDDLGRFYAMQDLGTDSPICKWYFAVPDGGAIVSSPTFVIQPQQELISAVFFGTTNGVFYALNGDGSLKWKYTVPQGRAITASPLLNTGGPIYFPAADGYLYALSLDGTFLFRTLVGAVSATFASSPLLSADVVIGTEDGAITALLLNGTLSWRVSTNGTPANPIVSSLGVGLTAVAPPLPTPRPTTPGTPVPRSTSTPTPTPTPASQARTIIYVVDRTGTVYALDEFTGQPISGVTIASGGAPTSSSPAISSDGCIIFGDDAGMLNVLHLDTIYGAMTPTPTVTPVSSSSSECVTRILDLTHGAAIHSSPAIDSGGVVYVGADDGRIYAIGTGANP